MNVWQWDKTRSLAHTRPFQEWPAYRLHNNKNISWSVQYSLIISHGKWVSVRVFCFTFYCCSCCCWSDITAGISSSVSQITLQFIIFASLIEYETSLFSVIIIRKKKGNRQEETRLFYNCIHAPSVSLLVRWPFRLISAYRRDSCLAGGHS